MKEIMQSCVDRVVGEGVFWLGGKLKLDIKVENNAQLEKYFANLNEHLKSGSLIVGFNHLSIVDPLIVYLLLERGLGDSMQRFVIPASSKFFDGRMGRISGSVLRYMQERKKIEAFPVVQASDDSATMDAVINLRALRPILQALGQPGAIIALSPEGTRSRTGQMIQAQPGAGLFISHCIKKEKNTMFVPVGIIGSEGVNKVDSKRFNLRHETGVVLGWPLELKYLLEQKQNLFPDESDDNKAMTDVAMLHIAQLLPEQYRGYYSVRNFPQFFNK